MPDTANSSPDPTNAQIAEILDELGHLYELDGAVIHRVVAYRNAAKAVREASTSVSALVRAGRVTELPGIGATLAQKLSDLLEAGEIPALVKLHARFPPGLVAMTRLPGLGPKRARRLYDELAIDSLEALAQAAREQRIRDLKGFGAKAEEALLAAIAEQEASGPVRRTVLHRALVIGEELVAAIRAVPGVHRAELAGSARRMTETVKDLDIIATADDPGAVAQAAAALELVESASSPGANAVRIRTHTGIGVDVRIVAPDQFGNLLQHLTGSKQHNVALRDHAVRRGLHVSEYGVLDDATGITHRCATEGEVYRLLGLDDIEPELRENRGEIEAAQAHTLPDLVTPADLRGDLHSHTFASDGTASIAEMGTAARDAGYEYLAITDHSASMGFGADVSVDELRRQIERIRTTTIDGLTLLAGSEVNVLPDGSLDYPDDVLAELDWVIASVHTSFRMPAAQMTDRILAAVRHPHVDCMGHLTGRKLEQRPGYEFDIDAVLDACVQTGTLLEINANPDRRDLSEINARAAASRGVGIVVNTDSHRTGGFAVARYGIATARRAWLTRDEVLNTLPWPELRARLPRHRA